jgi:O-antigen/teichoic acid export membrane protein
MANADQLLDQQGFQQAEQATDLSIGESNQVLSQAQIDPIPTSMSSESWSTTGIYDRSVYLMSLPITVLGKLSDSVMFSGLSQLQDDVPRLQRAYLSALYHIGLLVIPGSVFMVFFAEEITILFLGENFYESIPIVKILFISVAFRSLIKISDSVVRALDKVYTASAIKAMFFVLVAIGTYFGWAYGLEGVAWSLVFAVAIQFFMMKSFSLKLVKLNWSRLIKKLIPGVITGIIAVFASWAAQTLNPFISDRLFIRLLVALSLNAIILFAVAWFVPFLFKQGKDNVLATLATKIPIAALRKRWGSKA